MDNQRLFEIIAEQQKGHENEVEFTVGEQLREIAEHEPKSAALLLRDLQIKDMDLHAAALALQKYADENHKGSGSFCITPLVAEGILRKFYGLPERETPAQKAKDDAFIDLDSFL